MMRLLPVLGLAATALLQAVAAPSAGAQAANTRLTLTADMRSWPTSLAESCQSPGRSVPPQGRPNCPLAGFVEQPRPEPPVRRIVIHLGAQLRLRFAEQPANVAVNVVRPNTFNTRVVRLQSLRVNRRGGRLTLRLPRRVLARKAFLQISAHYEDDDSTLHYVRLIPKICSG